MLVRANENAQTALFFRRVTPNEIVGQPSALHGVDGGSTDIQIVFEIELEEEERNRSVKKISGKENGIGKSCSCVPRPTTG